MAAAEQNDTPMSDVADLSVDATDALFALSDDEKRVLALYDQVKTLQLEIALLKARQAYKPNESSPATPQALLEARAAYVLRDEVIDSVMTAHPLLRAVHGAVHASPIESDLLPAVEQRDSVVETLAQHAKDLHAVEAERVAVELQRRKIARQNTALAAKVCEMAAAEKALKEVVAADGDDDDEAAQGDKDLEAEVKAARHRWRLIKGATSAIIVGSGVNWTQDAALREAVLDPE